MVNDDEIEPLPVTKELIEEAIKNIGKPTGDPELDQLLADMRRCIDCNRDPQDKTTEPCDYCKPKPNYPEWAPEGTVFVCGACGKTSRNLYGERTGLGGWDESCMLNAVLCGADTLVYSGGRVVKAEAVEGY